MAGVSVIQSGESKLCANGGYKRVVQNNDCVSMVPGYCPGPAGSTSGSSPMRTPYPSREQLIH